MLPPSGCKVFFPHPNGRYMSVEMAIALAQQRGWADAAKSLLKHREKWMRHAANYGYENNPTT